MNQASAIETKPQLPGQRLWRHGPLLVWLCFIWIGSTGKFSAENTSSVLRPVILWFLPNLSESSLLLVQTLIRKAAHFGEYAVLAFFARRAFISSSRSLIREHWFKWSLLLVSVNALLDEFHQSFVPSRTGSIYDSFIDIAGGLTMLLILSLAGKRSRRSSTSEM